MSSGGDWFDSEDEDVSSERHEVSSRSRPAPEAPSPDGPAQTQPEARKHSYFSLLKYRFVGVIIGALIAIGYNFSAIRPFFGLEEVYDEDEQRAIDAREQKADESRARAREAREARDQARLEREEAKALASDIRRFWGGYDVESRDADARRLVELIESSSPRRVEPALRSVAAFDALMSIEKPEHTTRARVALRHERFEDITRLPPEAYAETAGAFSYCVAGDRGAALGIYKWLFANAMDTDYRDHAIACGANDDNMESQVATIGSDRGVAGVLAARNLPGAEEYYRNFATTRWKTSTERLSLATRLYVDANLPARELLNAARSARLYCYYLPYGQTGESELPPASLFDDALKKLATEVNAKDHEREFDALRVLAIQADLQRLKDRPRFTPKDERLQICVAQAAYEFAPEEAAKRLDALAKPDSEDWRLLTMLSLAHAGGGDFEAAYRAANRLHAIALPNHVSTNDANWMRLAFAHKLGRLDEVTADGIDYDLWLSVRLALIGDDSAKARFRVEAPPSIPAALPVAFYLRGATAPGHEELFIDAMETRAPLSTYFKARITAAEWRGDAEAAKIWRERRQRFHSRAVDGKNGGEHLLFTTL